MKSITLEEHFILPEVKDEMAKLVQPDPEGVPLKTMLEALESKTGFTDDDEIQNHEQRIKFMEEHNVAVQILSYGNGAPSNLTGEKAIELCRYANDKLYGYIEMYPERFLGFACIPINEPQAAAEELERAVTQLGFKGVLIPGRPHDGFLEQEKYDVIFAKAEALGSIGRAYIFTSCSSECGCLSSILQKRCIYRRYCRFICLLWLWMAR